MSFNSKGSWHDGKNAGLGTRKPGIALGQSLTCCVTLDGALPSGAGTESISTTFRSHRRQCLGMNLAWILAYVSSGGWSLGFWWGWQQCWPVSKLRGTSQGSSVGASVALASAGPESRAGSLTWEVGTLDMLTSHSELSCKLWFLYLWLGMVPGLPEGTGELRWGKHERHLLSSRL